MQLAAFSRTSTTLGGMVLLVDNALTMKQVDVHDNVSGEAERGDAKSAAASVRRHTHVNATWGTLSR